MEPVAPEIHSLNLQYFFRLLYEAGTGNGSFDASSLTVLASNIWIVVTVLAYLASIVLFGMFLHFTSRIYQVRAAESALYTTVSLSRLDSETDRSRWSHVMELIERGRESDWRQAIIEADIMLDEILEEQGYVGATVGDKLKQAKPERFATLQDAWDAHRVRNEIAHSGSSYQLTEHIAHRTIAHYENVFREFGQA